MKLTQFFIVFVLIYFVDCRNNVKSLSESLGQEVIEIGTPIKELPPGLEEEPSAENDEDNTSTSSSPPTTKRVTKRVVTTTAARTSVTTKEDDKEDSVSQEEEEARIEKELAEIYKDTDYKSDSSEIKGVSSNLTVEHEKPILRSRINFKFQPDVNNRQEVERFRTSVDEISCEKRVTQRLMGQSKGNTTSEFIMSFIQIGLVILSFVVCY